MPRVATGSRTNRRRNSIVASEPADVGTGVLEPVDETSDDRQDFEQPEVHSPDKLPFFDLLRTLSASDWESHVVYLYRLAPRVVNMGEYSYIDKFTVPIDEALVKEQHGGGRYQVRLNRYDSATQRSSTVREYKFTIEGQPKYLPGQTVKEPEPTQNPTPQVLPPGGVPGFDMNAFGRVMREVIEATRDKSGEDAQRIGMEVMTKAMTNAMDIQRKSLEHSAGSTTGNPMIDRFLEATIQRMTQGDDRSKRSGLEEKLIDIALAKISGEASAGAGILEQLGTIKDVLGIDFKELMTKGTHGRETWQGKLVDMGTAVVQNLPSMIGQLTAAQSQQLEKQIELERIRAANISNALKLRGLEPAAQIPPATPPAPAPAVPVPIVIEPQPEITSTEDNVRLIDDAIDEIVICWDAERSGAETAQRLVKLHPTAMGMLRPYLADAGQLLNWARNTPALAEIASDEEFPAFLQEFVATLTLSGSQPGPSTPAAPVA